MKISDDTIIYSLQKDDWDNVYAYLIGKIGLNTLNIDLQLLSKSEYIEPKDIGRIIKHYKELGYTEDEIKWIIRQITDFSLGILKIDKIEKLKAIGLFKNKKRFDDNDLKIIDRYFHNINDTTIYKSDLDTNTWILKLAKYFVINYYHKRENKSYSLDEYINMITLHILENTKHNNPKVKDSYKSINYHKRSIINYIKNMNKKRNNTDNIVYEDIGYDMNDFIDYLSESQELISYFNILTDRQKILLMSYYGFTIENGKLKKAPSFTLEELGRILNVSYQRVQQLLNLTKQEIINYKNKLEEKKMLESDDIYNDLTASQKAILKKLDDEDKINALKLFKEKVYNKKIIDKIKRIIVNTDDEAIILDILDLNEFIEEIEKQANKENNTKFIFK